VSWYGGGIVQAQGDDWIDLADWQKGDTNVVEIRLDYDSGDFNARLGNGSFQTAPLTGSPSTIDSILLSNEFGYDPADVCIRYLGVAGSADALDLVDG